MWKMEGGEDDNGLLIRCHHEADMDRDEYMSIQIRLGHELGKQKGMTRSN